MPSTTIRILDGGRPFRVINSAKAFRSFLSQSAASEIYRSVTRCKKVLVLLRDGCRLTVVFENDNFSHRKFESKNEGSMIEFITKNEGVYISDGWNVHWIGSESHGTQKAVFTTHECGKLLFEIELDLKGGKFIWDRGGCNTVFVEFRESLLSTGSIIVWESKVIVWSNV